MKERIRRHAQALGFEQCHFATAEPPASIDHFRRWLEQGCHGSMGYLERQAHKRADPAAVLPQIRSVISLAASYHAAPSSPRNPSALGAEPSGVVARYARGADYHDVLAAPLRALAEFVDQTGGPDVRSLWYVDTGPLLERDLAQRAGLGFIGKHTNLISRRLGNWFFLAEILTTLPLEPDPPERNHCGHCVRCLAACPTGAIVQPFTLDARRCISYLTIELKTSIPEELRPAIGDRIFGCDDCLAACPWNRFAREGRLMQAHLRPELERPPLTEWLRLDEAGFRRRFQGTPFWRTKRRGLLRNVAVALGNVGDERALPALAAAAQDPEPLIREHAAWAIERVEQRRRPMQAVVSSPEAPRTPAPRPEPDPNERPS